MPKKGYKQSPEHVRKNSLAKIGNKFSQGVKRSSETKQKMSLAQKGKHHYWLGKKKGPMPEWWKKRIRDANSGKNNWNWKGGITSERSKIWHSKEYRLWREAVFKRDNWTCVWCKAKSKKDKPVILNADHIKPFAYYPELRFAIDNGRTLCINCHRKTDTYGHKIHKVEELL